MVRRNYCVDLFGGERSKVSESRGGDGWRKDGGRGGRGANVLHLLGKTGNEIISSEGTPASQNGAFVEIEGLARSGCISAPRLNFLNVFKD